jgi:hypothetical protein
MTSQTLEEKVLAPVRAEVLLVEGGARLHTRNVIEFKSIVSSEPKCGSFPTSFFHEPRR